MQSCRKQSNRWLIGRVAPRYTSNDIIKTLFGVHAQVSFSQSILFLSTYPIYPDCKPNVSKLQTQYIDCFSLQTKLSIVLTCGTFSCRTFCCWPQAAKRNRLVHENGVGDGHHALLGFELVAKTLGRAKGALQRTAIQNRVRLADLGAHLGIQCLHLQPLKLHNTSM